MAIFLPTRRIIQPGSKVGIDWANQITRGLVAGWTGSFGYFAAGQPEQPLDWQTGSDILATPFGLAAKNTYLNGVTVPGPGTGDYTLLGLLWDTADWAGGWKGVCGLGTESPGLYHRDNTTGAIAVWSGVNRSSTYVYDNTYGTFYRKFPTLVGASRINGTLHFYYQGKEVGTPVTATESFPAATFRTTWTGYSATDIAYTILTAYWLRGVTSAEWAELNNNPWQIFAPIQKRTYFDMGAAQTGRTPGAIFLPQRWKKQPTTQLPISETFNDSCLAAYNFAVLPDGLGFTRSGTLEQRIISSNEGGAIGVSSSAGASQWTKTPNRKLVLSDPMWMVTQFYLNNYVDNKNYMLFDVSSSGAAPAYWRTGIATNQVRHLICPNTSGGELFINYDTFPASNKLYTIVGCRTGVNTGFGFSMGKEFSIAGSETGGTGGFAAINEKVLDGSVRANPITWGTLTMAAYGRGILPKGLAYDLSINPWQIFSPYKRRVIFDYGATQTYTYDLMPQICL